MTVPSFRCTADEPPEKVGGMYGAHHVLDSTGGFVLDEFVLEDVVHLEALSERAYHLRVGGFVFILAKRSGKWIARLEETP